jgi:hypothetical protein
MHQLAAQPAVPRSRRDGFVSRMDVVDPTHVVARAIAGVDDHAAAGARYPAGPKPSAPVQDRAAQKVGPCRLRDPMNAHSRQVRHPGIRPVRNQANRVAAAGQIAGQRVIGPVDPGTVGSRRCLVVARCRGDTAERIVAR